MKSCCILVTGIPASGKSTMAKYLSKELGIPMFSKDEIKERLFDTLGFQSREEKVRLGVAAMEIMSAKITKGMTNSVNRRVNCDTANVSKTVEAAAEQIKAIKRLKDTVGLENLPDKMEETALLRLFNPELSLSQLASMADPPVTKSCLNHRMKKLMEIAAETEL